MALNAAAEDVPKIVALVALGTFGWECILGLAFDWHLICEWRKKRVSWLSVAQYFLCKGGLLFFVAITVVCRLIQPQKVDCWAIINATNLSGGFTIWCASSIFALRAIALEGGWKRPLSILLALLWGMEGFFMAVRYRPRADIIPPYPGINGCHQGPVNPFYTSWMFAVVCMDVVAVCIMLRALFSSVGRPALQGGIGRILILDGMVFTMTTGFLAVTSGAITIIRGANPGPNYIAVSTSIFLTSSTGAVIATRSFRRVFLARERTRAPHDFFDLTRLPPSPVETPRTVFWRRGSDQSGFSPSLFGRRASEKSSPWASSAGLGGAGVGGGARRYSAPSLFTSISPGTRDPLDTSASGHTTALSATGSLSPLSHQFGSAHVPLLQVPDVAALRRKPAFVGASLSSTLVEQEEPRESLSKRHGQSNGEPTFDEDPTLAWSHVESDQAAAHSAEAPDQQRSCGSSSQQVQLEPITHCDPPRPASCAL